MALPTILVDSATGSDTQASGAGPASALFGTTDASTDGTGLIVTVTSGTNLSSVATDGSYVIFLNDTTAGARNFGKITGTSGSGGATPTVTVSDAFGTGLSSKSWAIGGRRASINNTTSRKLFENNSSSGDAMPGWIIELQSGHTETITSRITYRRSGDTTTGPITCRGASGGTRPVLTWSSDDHGFAGTGAPNYWYFKFLDLRNSSARTATPYAITAPSGGGQATKFTAEDIRINHATNKWSKGIFVSSGVTIRNCEIANCVSNAIEGATSDVVSGLIVDNCWIHDNGGRGFSLDATSGSGGNYFQFVNTVFANNTGHGIYLKTNANAPNGGVIAKFCDFYNQGSGSDGIRLDGTFGLYLAGTVITNCYFKGNGGYGINFVNSSTIAVTAAGPMVRNNGFQSNASGEIVANSVSVLTSDNLDYGRVSSLDPNNGGYGSSDGNYTKGSPYAGKSVGWPDVNVGTGSVTRSYVDVGVQQLNIGPAATSGTVASFKGIDIRQTTSRLIFRSELKDSDGVVLTSGTTLLAIYELQSDGTLKTLDWDDLTFKSTTCTTASSTMTHRTGNNSTTNTGIWSYVLTTLSGFTKGSVYLVQTTNSLATPNVQTREFQFGSLEGDMDDGIIGSVSTATSASSFTGNSTLSSSDEFYRGSVLVFSSGTLQDVARKVSGYVGATKTFTFTGTSLAADAPFPSAPASADTFVILGRIG